MYLVALHYAKFISLSQESLQNDHLDSHAIFKLYLILVDFKLIYLINTRLTSPFTQTFG